MKTHFADIKNRYTGMIKTRCGKLFSIYGKPPVSWTWKAVTCVKCKLGRGK